MCKPQNDQWDTNGEVNIPLEKGKKKDLSSYWCKNKALNLKKIAGIIPTFIIVKKTLFLLTVLQQWKRTFLLLIISFE